MGSIPAETTTERRANYNTVHGGTGNKAGSNNRRKIIHSGKEGTATEISEINIKKILHELESCRSEKAGLAEKLQLKNELLALGRDTDFTRNYS